MDKNEIIKQVDTESWDDILEAFEDGSIEEIEAVLDDRFPGKDNAELAETIFVAIKQC